jgi:hypothetical protein
MQQYTQRNYIYYNVPFFYVKDKHIYKHVRTQTMVTWLGEMPSTQQNEMQ